MKLTIALIVTRLAFANGQDYQALSCTSESAFLNDTIVSTSFGDNAFTCSEVALSVASSLICSDFSSRTGYREVQSTCCGGAEYLTELLCPEYEAYVPYEALSCTSESAFLSDGFYSFLSDNVETTLACSDIALTVASSPIVCSDFASRYGYRQAQSTCCGGAEYLTELLCPEYEAYASYKALSCTSESAFLSDGFISLSGIAYTCSDIALAVAQNLDCSNSYSRNKFSQAQLTCCGGTEYSTELLCPEYPAYVPFEALSCTSELTFLSDATALFGDGIAYTCSEVALEVASNLDCSDNFSRNAYREMQSRCCGVLEYLTVGDGTEYITELLCPEYTVLSNDDSPDLSNDDSPDLSNEDIPDLSNEDISSSLFIAPSVSVMAVIVVIAFFA